MNEVEIILNGQPYRLHPAFEALCRIERELDTGITALAGKLVEGTLTLEELVVIMTACTEPLPDFSIGDAIIKSGIAYVEQAVAAMFALVLSGSSTPAPTRGELETLR